MIWLLRRTLLILIILLPAARCLADPPDAINLRKTVVVEVVAKTKAAVVNICTTTLIRRRVGPFGEDESDSNN